MDIKFGTPNMFVLGSARSGTSSIYNVLSRHPEVQVSSIKEPSFFCSYFQDVSNPVTYFSLFDNRYKWRVDSSHVYLTNPESAEIIKRVFPQSRFVVIMRDPMKRAYSLFRYMRRYNHSDGFPYEDIEDFKSALQAEDGRYHTSEFWNDCRQYPWNFFYCRSSMYDEQLERYLIHFSRDQFLFLSLAQFANAPHLTCEKISKFLEIDSAPLLNSNNWRFNADPDVYEIPSETLELLNEKLGNVQSRVEALIGDFIDFSI